MCGEDISPDYTAISATDNCDTDVEITSADTNAPGSCASNYIITRTYTATDNCGNTTEFIQTITVVDDEAPVFDQTLSDIDGDCHDIPEMPVIGVDITATDACGSPVDIQFSQATAPGACDNDFTIVWTWTATDACGNIATLTQQVNITDNIDPVINGVPDDVTAACGEVPEIPEIGTGVTATDLCDTDVELTFAETTIDGVCDNTYTIVRTWTATDNCGNQSSVSQNIFIGDAAPPVFTMTPEDLTLDCGETATTPVIGVDVIVTDDCDTDIEVTVVESTITGSCLENYTIVRTWTATDACGNTATAIQNVYFEDNTVPTISAAPANLTLECGTTIPAAPATSSFVVTDNCDDAVEITLEETTIPGACPENYTIVRTWTATDNCGNTAAVSQEIEVEDTQDPVLSGVPSDITVECHLIPDPPAINSVILATDNCTNSVEIIADEFIIPGDCPDSYTIVREWIAIDNCGNVDSKNQKITVFDNTPPTISGVPADVTVNLNIGQTIPAVPGNILGTDNCDTNVNIVFEEIETPQGCGSIIERKWTATDNCGNTSVATQNITVLDDIEVVITPSDISLCTPENAGLSVTPSGAGYVYQWTATGGTFNNSQIANPTFGSTVTGTFTIEVTVTSPSGCTQTDQITITVNQGTLAEANYNGPLCENNTLEFYGSGGVTYLWTGPNDYTSTEQNPTIENAQTSDSGEYILLVSNGQGCPTYDTVNVLITPDIAVDFSAFSATCSTLGSITLGLAGGTGDYFFDWGDINENPDPQNRIDLLPGTYNVTITDEGGCEVIVSNIIIGDECQSCDAVAGDLIADNFELCLENGNAIISATAVGNTIVPPGYAVIYILTTDPNMTILQTNNTPDFVVMEGGDYTIHTFVYDPALYNINDVVLGQTSLFEINALLIQGGGELCGAIDLNGAETIINEVLVEVESVVADNCGSGSGSIILSPDTYTYQWNDNVTGPVREGLNAGTYQVTVTDNINCSTLLTVVVDAECVCITPEISSVVAEPECGEASGAINIQVDGDPADYVYTWSNNTNGTFNATGNEVTGVMNGIYTVTVTYPFVANCDTIVNVTVGISDGPEPDVITISPASCDAENGSADLSPNTLTYIWVHDNLTAGYRENLACGTYQVIVLDPANPQCPNIVEVEIACLNPLFVEAIIISEPICGNADGQVELNISGGSGTYNFQWSDPASVNDSIRTDLAAGNYTVTVTDTDGSNCEYITSFTLLDFTPGVTLLVNPNVGVSCNGFADGMLDYEVNYDPGFPTPATIEIKDSLGNIYTNGALPVGTYCIEVIAPNGCVGAQECFDVTEPELLSVSSVAVDEECGVLGSIDITVLGGTGNYTYNWGDINTPNEPEDRTELEAGSYIVTVTDENDCIAVEFGILIGDNCLDPECTDPVVENTTVIEATCGDANGSITIDMTGDEADFVYTWPAGVLSTSHIATGLSAGTYEVTITDVTGECEIVESINVSNSDATPVTIVSTTPATCLAADGTAELSPASLDYDWDGFTGAVQTSLLAGTYIVTATNASGCETIIEVIIESISTLEATVTIDAEPTCGESNGQVTIVAANGSGDYTYNLGPVLSDLTSGTYDIIVTDNQTGCTAELSFTLNDNVAGAVVTVADVELSCAGDANGEANYSINYDAGFATPSNIEITDVTGAVVTNGTLSVGTYCIVVTDANTCIATTECFEVTEPTILEVSVSTTDATCDPVGAIDLTTTGGIAPYDYNWSSGNGTGLLEGIYAVTITDANGCDLIVENIVVGKDCDDDLCTDPIVENTTVIESTCGDANGSITIDMVGDENDFIYTWPAGIISTSNIATNLSSGTYEVTITDVTGECEIIESINVSNSDATPVTIVSTTPATCLAADGTAELSPAFLTYNWGTFTGAVQTNLLAGTYTVTATNASGCETIIEVIIESISTLEATATIDTEPTCGESNGEVTIIATNGSGDYTYSLGNSVMTDLSSGNYTVTVTDNQTACTAEVDFTLEDNVVGATITVSDVELSCSGNANGTVVYTTDYETGFATPATEVLTDEFGAAAINGTLSVGTYCITITDANGCIATTECFEVTEPLALEVSVATTDATCDPVGAIDLTTTGGTAPYDYNWSSGAGTGLTEGSYSVTITDANDCTLTVENIIIGQDCTTCTDPIVENTTVIESTCGNANGSITIEMVGDETDFVYTWSIGVISTSHIATDLMSGTYEVTITDATGDCEIVESINISNSDATPVTIVSTTPATCLAADGTAELSPAFLTYNWGSFTGAVQTNLLAGTYTVTATNASGCETIIEVIIESISTLEATATIDTEPTCGEPNGQVTIIATNGSGDYSYSSGSLIMTDLSSGVYTVTVTDNQTGCTAEVDFTLEDNVAGATITVSDVELSCSGDANGTVVYTTDYETGFATPATETLTDEFGAVVTNGNLSVGTYCITITDANGCIAGTECFEVMEPAVLEVSVATTDATCDPVGAIDLTTTGGTAPYDYNWSSGAGTGLTEGTYSVTITDANDCTLTVENIIIGQDCTTCTDPIVENTTVIESTCGDANGSITIEMVGDETDFVYTWPIGVISTSHIATDLMSGTYEVTITDATGDCEITESINVSNSDATPVTIVSTTPATCLAANGTAELSPAFLTYNWGAFTGAVQTNLLAGTYTVTATNASGCETIIEVIIESISTLEATATIDTEPTCGESNGQVTIIASNGSGDYSYSSGSLIMTDLASGLYSVTVTDNQTGCTAEANFTLEDNVAGATITVSDVELSCSGDANGTVVYTTDYETGFATPATEVITDEFGAAAINGTLSVGTYCITITDANDCLAATECFEVTEPLALEVSVATTDATCDPVGAIDLTTTGGTAPYDYNWSSGAGTGLTEGTYSVTITDANDCTLTVENIIIGQDCTTCTDPIVENTTVIESTCGDANGSITIEMVGDETDFVYTWPIGVISTSHIATDLMSGTYEVTITDATGDCEITESINVSNSDATPVTIISTTPATCLAANGTAELSPAFLTYNWGSFTGAVQTNLLAGTYTVTATNASGCETIIEVIIESISTLEATAAIDTEPTCGESNGQVTIIATNGSGDYSYSSGSLIMTDLASGLYSVTVTDNQTGCTAEVNFTLEDNVAGVTITVSDVELSCSGDANGTVVYTTDYETGFATPATEVLTDEFGAVVTNGTLSVGTYCITITDANGCIAGTECFEVTEPLVLEVSVATTDATCDPVGAIDLTTTGGTAPYDYNWSSGAGAGLTEGTYSVTITDANDCTLAVENIIIGQDCTTCTDPIVENTIVIESTCGNTNGSITIEMVGDETDFVYTWPIGVISTSHIATDLTSGTYEVTITDATGDCEIVEIINVSNSDATPVTIVSTTPATCLAANGTAELSPAFLTYNWGAFTGAVQTNLLAGTYTVTATNASGCETIIEVIIESISTLEATAVIDTEPTCGESNGQVTIIASNGSGDYSYSSGSLIMTDLASGVYAVTVTDNQTGCTAEANFTLEDNIAGATITVSDVELSCSGDANGTVVYTTDYETGFATPATEVLTDELGAVVTNGALSVGTYCITITDVNGCLAATECFEVIEPAVLEVSVATTDATCDPVGAIDLTTTGGTAPYDYNWSSGAGTGLTEGSYSVTITDANDCTLTVDNIIIGQDCTTCTDPIVENTTVIESTCGDANGSITIEMVGDETDFVYTWPIGVISTSHIATDLMSGTYEVTITDATGDCEITESINVSNSDATPVTIVSTTPATCLAANGTAELSPAFLTYNWGAFTGAVQTNLLAGTYTVTATNASDCETIIEVVIESISTLEATAAIDTEPTCGESNGQVTIIATNGSGDYSYSSGSLIMTDLASGLYSITVTDNQTGCTAEVNFGLEDNIAGATITVSDVELSCSGDANGTVVYTTDYETGFATPATEIITDEFGVVVTNGALSVGTYCITITDANGCLAATECFEVIEPAVLEVSVATTDATCDPVGAIDLTTTGGTAPYDYNWSSGAGTGLTEGTYSVTITDANDCTLTVENIIIGQDCTTCTDPIVENTTVIESTCGDANGSITIEMVGDEADFVYTWPIGVISTSHIATDLMSGTYEVTITDATGDCEITESINISNSDATPVTIVSTTPATCLAADGTAELSPAFLTYNWGSFTGAVQTNLLAGTYTVTATNASGCETIIEVIIESISTLEATATIDTEPTCGEPNGQVTIIATNGSGDYSYSSGSLIMTDLSSGVYTVTVTDNQTGCTAEVDFTLEDNVAGATITVSDVELSCSGDANGTVVYTTDYETGFATPATETLTDEFGAVVTNGNLSVGTYCITITDANGCIAGTECFEVMEPAVLEVSVATTDATCDPVGAIDLTTTGGTAPYDYNWSSGAGTGLTEGTYSVTITDANDCTLTVENIIIGQDCTTCTDPIVENTTVIESTCGDANGSITIEMVGDETDFVYTWPIGVISTSHIATDLMSGTYEVTITDATGDCEITESINVSNSDATPVTIVSTTPATCLAANGTAELSPAFLTYNWGAFTGAVQTNLLAGTYTVTATNASGCETIIEVIIESISTLEATATIDTEPTCGESNGQVTIIASNGSGDYSYSSGSLIMTDLASGLYSVTVTDNQTGCTAEANFTLEDNVAGATITVSDVELSCSGDANGTVVYTTDYETGFATPATEVITDEFGAAAINGTLSVGTYCITITDANDCLAATECFEVTEPLALEVSVATTDATCDPVGAIDLTTTGGTAPYDYNWSSGAGTGLTEGTYSVTITDANDCTLTVENIIIGQDCTTCTDPIVENTTVIESTCGDANGSITIEMVGDETDFVYTWPIGVISTSHIATDLMSGTYEVTITDATGDCEITESINVSNSDATPVTIISTTPATCLAANGTAELSPAFLTYNWGAFTGAVQTNLLAGTYTVTATNASGCETIIEVIIESISTLEATAAIDTEPTCGESNGQVTIIATNGSGDYSYSSGSLIMTDLASGLYSVTVTDNQTGCTAEVNFTLEDNVAGVTITVSDVELSCSGDANGTVVYTTDYETGFATPATEVLTDEFGAVVTNGTLSVGTYCITITDANGCIAGTECFEVTEPLVLEVSVATTDATCDPVGAIDLTTTGGTAPYDYNWSSGAGAGLTEGTYSVTITDANDCTLAVENIIIGQDCTTCTDPIVENTIVIESTCGNTNGSITIEMVGDETDFVYTWPIGVISTSHIATDLTSGTYEVTITDATGDCEIVEIINVSNSDATPVTIVSTTPATCLAANGTAELSPAFLTYNWGAFTGAVQTNLLAGTYTVTATNASGCETIIEVVIESISTLEATAVIDTEPTCGESNGQVTIIASNGSGDYSYSSGSLIMTDLASGVYAVTVTDNQTGCTAEVNFTLEDNIAGATITVSDVELSCSGDANGTVVYTTDYETGFATPATEIITDEFGAVVTNGTLSVGTYCITITDVNGCLAATECFEVIEPATLEVSVATTDATCDPVGAIDLTTTGGTAPYDYNWSSGAGTGLTEGSYSVTITDANDCTLTVDNIIIGQDCTTCTDPIVENTTVIESTCGDANGSITIEMVGDETDFVYTWPIGVISTSHIATDLMSGTYEVTITDATGDCEITESINVSNSDGTPVTIISTTPATCLAANGTAELSPAFLTYNWGAFTGAVQTNLLAGTYTVTATNASDCETIIEVVIESISTLEAIVAIDTEPTCGESNGQVTIIATNGSGDYSYSSGSLIMTDLASGLYSVTVTDNQTGCTAEVNFGLEDNIAGATITVSDVELSCSGDANGTVVYTTDYETGFATPATEIITDEFGAVVTNGALSVGTYCITITDANGCLAATECFEVIEPAVLEVSVATTDATCDPVGAIDLTTTGGTAPYDYNWSGGTGTGLTEGTYSVTITDANGCTLTVENIIIGKDCDQVCVNPEIDNIIVIESACGQSNGSITVEMQGSESNYVYTWAGSSNTSNEFLNLSAGIYVLTISDINDDNCFIIETITISDEGSTPVDTVSTTPANCTASDGTAELSPANLTYTWSDGGTGAIRTDLEAGDYTIIGMNAAGCETVYELTINAVSPLEANVTIDIEPTCGEANGQVSINVDNGSGDYTYDPAQIITNLASGVYTVTVTDNQTACTTEVTFTLNDNIAGAIITTSDVVLPCSGDINGTVVYTVDYESGFATPVTEMIVDEFGTPVTNGTLRAGIYCIIITDANDCVASTECFEVTEPAILETSIATTDVLCGASGAIELTTTGGTAPYDYNWNGLDPTNLPQGMYSVTITDNNDCLLIVENIEIEASCPDDCTQLPVVDNIIKVESTCGESNGSITIFMDGDESDFDFDWSGNVGEMNTATDLPAGDYSITITDNSDANCSIIELVTIGNQDGPQIEIIDVNPATCLLDDGTAVLGPAGLIYTWSDNQGGAIRANLEPGVYTVTGTDNNGCFDVVEVEIGSTNNLSATATIVTNPTCGEANGEVEIIVAGGSGDYTYDPQTGIPSGTYTVIITDNVTGCTTDLVYTLTDDVAGAMVTANDIILACFDGNTATAFADYTIDFEPGFALPESIEIRNGNNEVVTDGDLTIGTYCIIVLDANACIAGQDCFEITEPDAIDVTVTVVNQTCDDLGSIVLEVTGGTAPYTFDWNGNDPESLEANIYSVTVTDANACQEIIENIIVGNDCGGCDLPVIDNIVVIESNCGQSDGSITIIMEGNIADYSYNWSPSNIDSNIITDLTAATYTVTITDVNNAGCFIIETITVGNEDGPEVIIISTTPATCTDADGSVELSPANLTYTWSDIGVGPIRTDLAAGTYEVTATDDNGCFTILEVMIDAESTLEASVSIDAEPTCGEANGQATINITNGSGDYTYNPTWPILPGLESGNYTITVTDNQTGCTTEVSFVLNDNVAGATIEVVDVMLACSGDANGMANYNVTYESGFATPATEMIVDEFGTPVTNGMLSAGTYCIIITDANDCSAATECFEVIEPMAIEVTVSRTDVLCDTLGNITLGVNGGTTPYTYDWNGFNPDSLTVGLYSVTITDANGCSVIISDIEIAEQTCPENCEDYIVNDVENIMIQDCSGEGFFCVNIPLEEYLNYTITDNGEPYDGTIGGCDFDSTMSYSVFAIPSQGTFGPYVLEVWNVEGQSFSTGFDEIQQLVDSMNVWDPTGNWVFDQVSFLLVGGDNANTYGNMNITQTATGAFTSLEVNTNLTPNGLSVGVTEGQHEMIFVETLTGCADTVDVLVLCIAPEVYSDTIQLNTQDTFCIDLSELPGAVVSVENVCEEESGEYVVFEIDDDEWCVTYWGAEVGVDTACIVACDDIGFCDTTYIYVTVEDLDNVEPDNLPVAVVDYDTTLVNTTIGIQVVMNDTLDGFLDSIYVTDDPDHGILINNEDGTFIYIPAEDYCDLETPDSFVYVVCTEDGCDTATVFITVLCDNIIIFTGFSPNGDGVNDYFQIEGINEFPNNELSVFNRWGNEIYHVKGYLNDWDGTWKNKNLPDGTYFYVLEDGEGNTYSGYVQIHR